MIKKFSLPDYYNKGKYILDLSFYMKNNSDKFYSDRIIDSAYGAHPSLLWTGGRFITDQYAMLMSDVLHEFNKIPEIKLHHVCTNLLMTPELVTDYKSNYFFLHYIRSEDKAIIAHPLLIDHFKYNYPKISLIYSTTMNIKDIETVNEITKKNIYVLNYNYNYNDIYIKQLLYPNNIEVLCGEPCILNCPNREKHYKEISKIALQINEGIYTCPYEVEKYTADEILSLPHAMTNERIDQLSEMGIQYFKISGRSLDLPNWLAIILYYLALPEHREKIFFQLLRNWYMEDNLSK